MILNKKLYTPISYFRSLWNQRQLTKLTGDKVFKTFKLHKAEWPDKLYFYSPRLKRIPRFIGTEKDLSSWKESKLCETLCPTQAIKVTSKSFEIDSRGCIACGLCVELAPPGLMELTPEPDSLIRI